jgi:hypothetical protein
MILSEDDLKCHLFRLLYEEERISQRQRTMDNDIWGTRIHTEIKFFNADIKLLDRPDITILSPKNRSILHSIQDV